MIDEIVNEWIKRVTEVAVPYPIGTSQYETWKEVQNKNYRHIKALAEELR